MTSTTTADVPKPTGTAQVPLPYITIKFCVQCRWNLRAAYFAQELLQTFSTTLGSIALVPVTDGVFTIAILTESTFPSTSTEPIQTLLWDRKTEGGFPETKELKNRVRNVVDPGRDMGHIDRRLRKDREGKEGQGIEGEGEATLVGGASESTSTAQPSIGLESNPPVSETPKAEATQKSHEECEDCK